MNLKDLFKKAEQLRGLENLDEAIELYNQVVENSSESTFEKAESLHMIGLIYYQQEKYDLSRQFLRDAEECFESLNDEVMKAAVLRDRAMIAEKEENYAQAKGFLLQSIQILEGYDRQGHLGISKVKLGVLYQKEGNLTEAEHEILEGIAAIKDSDDKFFESSGYFSLARLQKERGELEEAKLSANRAIELLERIVPGKLHLKRKNEMKKFIEEFN